jgi:carbamoyl-phosphate synthase large subunit
MEVAKCLHLDGGFTVYGCDISSRAFGHFSEVFDGTVTVDRSEPLIKMKDFHTQNPFDFLIAGGDEVARICATLDEELAEFGVQFIGNDPSVVALCSDKFTSMRRLREIGIATPWTDLLVNCDAHDEDLPYPLIVKPRRESGGSRGVSVVQSVREFSQLKGTLAIVGDNYVCQEYLAQQTDELTIGVLSDSERNPAGAILMRRSFHSRLSVMESTAAFLISSGSSQGDIFTNPAIADQALAIATALKSLGPMNIQGRLRGEVLLPFEINPRFSASVYLRALAGVNEPALLIRHLVDGTPLDYPQYTNGLALRAFTEVFIPGADTSV